MSDSPTVPGVGRWRAMAGFAVIAQSMNFGR